MSIHHADQSLSHDIIGGHLPGLRVHRRSVRGARGRVVGPESSMRQGGRAIIHDFQ
jgi:hypothetical protein